MPRLTEEGMNRWKRVFRRRGAESPPAVRRRSLSVVDGVMLVMEKEEVVVPPVVVRRGASARRGRGGRVRGRRGGVAASSPTPSSVRDGSPGPRLPHGPAATRERIQTLARISMVLQFISLLTGSTNPWWLVRKCFFSALGLDFNAVNGRKVAAEAKKSKVSQAILGLRKKKNRSNEHFIATPFQRNIRLRDLINQLRGPLVGTLNGWKMICVVAKQLNAPLRLLVAEAKCHGVEREDHCMQHIQNFMVDGNMRSQLDEWFEEGQGEGLMATIGNQLSMMEKEVAVGWALGIEESSDDEIDEKIDVEDSGSSDDSADAKQRSSIGSDNLSTMSLLGYSLRDASPQLQQPDLTVIPLRPITMTQLQEIRKSTIVSPIVSPRNLVNNGGSSKTSTSSSSSRSLVSSPKKKKKDEPIARSTYYFRERKQKNAQANNTPTNNIFQLPSDFRK